MEKISLYEASKLVFTNKYNADRIVESVKLLDTINKFYPCEGFAHIEKYDNSYSLEHITLSLTNDICNIHINYDSYRKKYDIFLYEHFEHIQSYNRTKIYDLFKEPNKIGVLTTKKIQSWVDYCQSVYLKLKESNEQSISHIDIFLKSIENEDVRWYNNKTHGEIIRNGIVFSFKIETGYISKNIALHYSVSNDLETFKKLSENKL